MSRWGKHLAGGSSAPMQVSELSTEGLLSEPWSSDTLSSAPEPPRDATLSSTASDSALSTDGSAMFTGRLALCDLLAGAACGRSKKVRSILQVRGACMRPC